MGKHMSVIRAVIVFISSYFVFHIGYGNDYCQFLGFMQQVLLGIPYEGKKNNNFVMNMKKSDKCLMDVEEGCKFKKVVHLKLTYWIHAYF